MINHAPATVSQPCKDPSGKVGIVGLGGCFSTSAFAPVATASAAVAVVVVVVPPL